MKSLSVLALLLSSVVYASVATTTSIVPYGNGTWAYDNVTYTHPPVVSPGLFQPEIKAYNNPQSTVGSHEMNEVFAYGSDMEMYCQGSGGAGKDIPCTPDTMFAYFGLKNNNGVDSVHHYLGVTSSGIPQYNLPVIDGRMDETGADDLLSALNKLTPAQASAYADQVAAEVCNDEDVDGVQFDLEPFSFTGLGSTQAGSGQQYFYTQIAKDFAGYHSNPADPAGIDVGGSDSLHCVDKAHPNGRVFSVFTFSGAVTPDVATVFTHHNNGFIVDSLYDLGVDKVSPPKTVADIIANSHTPDQFKALAATEISNMKAVADKDNVPYQFAIPAAASVHEFETVTLNGQSASTGYQQQAYVQAALDAIDASGVRQDPLFKGVDVWS